MQKTNICKFIEIKELEPLSIKNFVCETDPEIMRRESRLISHRAILVTGGAVNFTVNESPLLLECGDLLFVFEGDNYSASPISDGATYSFISFVGSRATLLFERFGINRQNRVFTGNANMIPFWNDSIFASSENADLSAEGVLLYTFSRLDKAEIPHDNAVVQAARIMDDGFSDQNMCCASVAYELGYNSKYLSQLFKKSRGVSISDYLRNLRIKHAVFLLDHGIESIKNVALLSGFKDQFHFSNVFKTMVGTSPTEYKNKS